MIKLRIIGLSLVALACFNKFLDTDLPTLAAGPTNTPTPIAADAGIDLTHLPLGDGKLSTAPKVGWIWPCHIEANGGGAFQTGPWFNGDGTYNLKAKPAVSGAVNWAQHKITITVEGDQRIITTNDLPDHPTGVYPIAATDAAFKYDRNPNKIAAQNFRVTLPANPVLAAQPSCAPGAVGILVSGVSLFNALDAPGRDANAHELQDNCQGHPQVSGAYHYHSLSNCITDNVLEDGHSGLMGYAVDGFGIYGRYGENGKILTSADLDECHGHTHEIEWNGQKIVMYHYHATADFPYTVGCMRGTFNMQTVMTISGGPAQGPGNGGKPGQPGQPPAPPPPGQKP